MKVSYEWDRETVDEHGDIVDHNHAAKLATIFADEGELVLVRDSYTDGEGVQDREWAYVKDGKLPEFFCGGSRVPKRFHAELARVSS